METKMSKAPEFQAKIVGVNNFAFTVEIRKAGELLGTKRVPKPTSVAADGWMQRGQAKTEMEAMRVAIAWAGGAAV